MSDVDRRSFLVTSVGVLGAVALPACKPRADEAPAPAAASAPVRVASVPTAIEGHLLPRLVEVFTRARRIASS